MKNTLKGHLSVKTIEISGLYRSFGDKQVLNGIDLSLEQGEFICIVGKSGSGKSTLINIIGTLDSNYKGVYHFLGKDVSKCSKNELAKIRNSCIGFIFQMYQLINEYTVKENILLPLLYNKNKIVSKEYYHVLLEQLQINDLENKKVIDLSGGEKQRVAIARASINKPSVIIADEPTGNLDPENTEKVINMFKCLKEKGVSIIMVSHDTDAASKADRILKLEGGKIK